MEKARRLKMAYAELLKRNLVDSQKDLAQKMGTTPPNVSAAMKGEPKVLTDSFIRRFNAAFDNLFDLDWLLRGEGDDMIREAYPSKEPDRELRPRIPYDAEAGHLGSYLMGVTDADCEMIPLFPTFPAYDFTMTIRGNSMAPTFETGDEVALRKVHSIIEWGRPYIIDTLDGVLLKRLYDNGDSLRCVSINPEYPDIIISKEDIRGAYKVVGQIRRWASS